MSQENTKETKKIYNLLKEFLTYNQKLEKKELNHDIYGIGSVLDFNDIKFHVYEKKFKSFGNPFSNPKNKEESLHQTKLNDLNKNIGNLITADFIVKKFILENNTDFSLIEGYIKENNTNQLNAIAKTASDCLLEVYKINKNNQNFKKCLKNYAELMLNLNLESYQFGLESLDNKGKKMEPFLNYEEFRDIYVIDLSIHDKFNENYKRVTIDTLTYESPLKEFILFIPENNQNNVYSTKITCSQNNQDCSLLIGDKEIPLNKEEQNNILDVINFKNISVALELKVQELKNEYSEKIKEEDNQNNANTVIKNLSTIREKYIREKLEESKKLKN